MMRKRLISSTLVIGLLLSSATGCASTSKILKDAEQRSLADSKDAHTMETSTSSTTDATTTVPSETEIDITTGYDPYVGAIVTYGNYAGSPIEWIVLDKGENDELFLVSRYVLDVQPYDTTQTSVSWEDCTLRQWLNNDFYTTAFSEPEQNAISVSTVFNDDYDLSGNYIRSSNTTSDKVFILNCKEVMDYLTKLYPSVCKPTDYALQNGVLLTSDTNFEGCGDWWYRTNGEQDALHDLTNLDLVNNETARTTKGKIGVRPAIRVRNDVVSPTETANEHIGDTITFGTYQGAPIEWNIIDRNEYGEILLLSRYVIDVRAFDDVPNDVSGDMYWANSSLREWLNTDFMNVAFTTDEQGAIVKKRIEGSRNIEFVGNTQTLYWDSEDAVFLLSQAEVSAELPNGHIGFVTCGFTEYAKNNGLNCDPTGNSCDYWFRDPGSQAGTTRSSWTKETGRSVNEATTGVRPAVWVKAETLELSLGTEISAPENTEPLRPYLDSNPYLQVGDIVTFGAYGGEAMNWIILEKNATGDAALVINQKVIDAKPYYTGTDAICSDNAWSLSTLRTWLNADFLNVAFDGTQQSRILQTRISDGGNDTDNFLFLLSFDEMQKYMKEFTPCQASAFAKSQGVAASENYFDYAPYWLRCGGVDPQPARVSTFGQYYRMGELAYSEPSMGVRPAMWVVLPSDTSVIGHFENVSPYITLVSFPMNDQPITWKETPVNNIPFYTTCDVAIRKGPSQEYEAVGILPETYQVYQTAYIGETESECEYIKIDNGYYIAREYLHSF